jgi:hypothetical protein
LLAAQPKDRRKKSEEKYGIKQDYSILFFFELKDDIFTTSSTDTDKYKIIKYNNVLSIFTIFYIIRFKFRSNHFI